LKGAARGTLTLDGFFERAEFLQQRFDGLPVFVDKLARALEVGCGGGLFQRRTILI